MNTFLKGTAEEKIAALDCLQERHSWSTKRWIQRALYDADVNVRLRAAKYISDIAYLHYLPDMRMAYQTERDEAYKSKFKAYLAQLEAQFPDNKK